MPPAPANLVLPATLLSRYLFFLGRRPVSASNTHFLTRRIEALKSLAPFFAQDEDGESHRIARHLQLLTGANLARAGTRIHAGLRPLLVRELPRDVVASRQPPQSRFWSGTRRTLLVFGPGIGVGDEILCASIPRALRSLMPDTAVSILTTYDGVWDTADAGTVEQYRDLSTLVEAVRAGDHQHDLLVLADFEAPALASCIAMEPAAGRYLEISIGARSLVALDNRARQLRQMPSLDPYCANFYDWLRAALRWLGADDVPRFAPGRPAADASGALVMLVSPFTSKEDPSERYWTTLVASLLPDELTRRVTLLIDTGPNADTKSFALALRTYARAHLGPAVRCDLAAAPNGGVASLRDILGCARSGLDVVITADSYLAHAAPAAGAMTFVVAGRGLENWRVPAANSFYFSLSDAAETVAAAMRALLAERFTCTAASFRPSASAEARRLREAVSRLQQTLADGSGDLLAPWRDCYQASAAVVAALPEWPRAYEALAGDQVYARLMPVPPTGSSTVSEDEQTHLSHRLAECENSNVWKYLGAARA